MHDATSLWAELRSEYPERAARIADRLEPVDGTAQDFVERLLDLEQSASIGNDKSGTIGNPYERPADGLSALLRAAERISGLTAKSRWERPNNSFKPTPSARLNSKR